MENDAISRAWLLEQLQDLGNTTLLKRNFIALVENAPAEENMTVGRLKELSEADKDGRLVVLP